MREALAISPEAPRHCPSTLILLAREPRFDYLADTATLRGKGITVRYCRPLAVVVAIAVSAALIACTGALSFAKPARDAGPSEGVPGFGHVFLIVGENTELGQLNKQDAPFMLGQLKPRSA
jgi:hypothetical protein